MRLLIKGGTVVDPSQHLKRRLDLLIEDGRVAALENGIDTSGAQVFDARGLVTVPGLIDLHTHLREPGYEYKETVATGSRAAAAGGFTSITALPNTRPVMDSREIVEYVRRQAEQAGLVRVWPVGSVSKRSHRSELADFVGMHAAGIKAVTDDGRGVTDAGLVRKALLKCRELGLTLFEHCEEESLSGFGQMHEGSVSARLGIPGIPASAETVMLARDLLLAGETGAKLHIMHVSTACAVGMIRKAKQAGIPVTAEVTPHHLLLTDEAVTTLGSMAKMKPPLRGQSDLDALLTGLLDGTLDAVATDHAPHTEEEKSAGFEQAPFGITGLETAFPLLYTNLVRNGPMTLETLVERMSCSPAAILGIPHGSLRIGAEADLAVFDLESEYIINRNNFQSRGKNTPFDGWRVFGRPELTVVAGREVMRDGKITAEKRRIDGRNEGAY